MVEGLPFCWKVEKRVILVEVEIGDHGPLANSSSFFTSVTLGFLVFRTPDSKAVVLIFGGKCASRPFWVSGVQDPHASSQDPFFMPSPHKWALLECPWLSAFFLPLLTAAESRRFFSHNTSLHSLCTPFFLVLPSL